MSKKWFGGVNQNHGILLRFSGSSEKGDIISSSIRFTNIIINI